MPHDEPAIWIESENLTEEQIEEGRRALESLIKTMARATVDACHKLGIEFDMDDPEVARDVMKATFDGMFMTPRAPRPKSRRRARDSD